MAPASKPKRGDETNAAARSKDQIPRKKLQPTEGVAHRSDIKTALETLGCQAVVMNQFVTEYLKALASCDSKEERQQHAGKLESVLDFYFLEHQQDMVTMGLSFNVKVQL